MSAPRHTARLLTLPALGLALALANLSLDDDGGVRLWLELRRAVAESTDRVRALEAEREGLLDEIRALRTQPLAVERHARERLGMVRPGERVLRWDPGEIAR